ncbi:MAG: AMP-binding protein [Bacteroidota bacterium]
MIGSLTVNNRVVDLNHLPEFKPLTDFENSTIEFIHTWLSGEREFSIQTSGSTGKPKRINLTRDQMEASARATNSFFGLTKGDTIFVCLNTAYIAGQMMLVRALLGSLNVIAIEPGSKPDLPNHNSPIHFMAFVPLQIKNLLPDGLLNKFDRLKGIIIGGAPIDKELEARLSTLTIPSYATFGMTETVSHIALRKLNGKDKSEYYVALPGVQLGVENDCLTIEGKVTGLRKVVTTDLVELKNNTTFKWLGRKGNVVNSGGVKIHIDQVEKELSELMKELRISNRFLCAKKKDSQLGEKLVLVFEGVVNRTSLKDLLHNAKKKLPKYWDPKEVMTMAKLPETPTGKLDRKEINLKLVST